MVDQVQDATDRVASSLFGQIEAISRKKYLSIGMAEFCINSTSEITCKGLPINLRVILVIGWFSLLAGNVLKLRILRTMISFVLSPILFIPFAAPIVLLYIIRTAAQQAAELNSGTL